MMEIDYISCGDCLKLMKNVPDESIDLIVTDPPYKVTSRGNAGTMGGMVTKEINLKGKVFKFNDIHCSEYASEFYRVLKDKSHCYIMTNHINLYDMLTEFTKAGFHFTKSLIWDKGNKICCPYYMSQFEYILFFRKGKSKKINDCGTSDILSVPNKKLKDKNNKNLHDTEKPIKLMQILIENSSNKENIILDPFMGIGSVPIACINTNRHYIGFELDEQYFDIACQRLDEVEGETE